MRPSVIKLVPVETQLPEDHSKDESPEVCLVLGLEVMGQGCCTGRVTGHVRNIWVRRKRRKPFMQGAYWSEGRVRS